MKMLRTKPILSIFVGLSSILCLCNSSIARDCDASFDNEFDIVVEGGYEGCLCIDTNANGEIQTGSYINITGSKEYISNGYINGRRLSFARDLGTDQIWEGWLSADGNALVAGTYHHTQTGTMTTTTHYWYGLEDTTSDISHSGQLKSTYKEFNYDILWNDDDAYPAEGDLKLCVETENEISGWVWLEDNYCEDYTNSTSCEADGKCDWDSGSSTCIPVDCSQSSTQTTCNATAECLWLTSSSQCLPRYCFTRDQSECEMTSGCGWFDSQCYEQIEGYSQASQLHFRRARHKQLWVGLIEYDSSNSDYVYGQVSGYMGQPSRIPWTATLKDGSAGKDGVCDVL